MGEAPCDVPPDAAKVLVDPQAYADGRIHATYRWLRLHQPLGIATPSGFDPFWVVTRHADVLHVSRNNDLFRNGDRSALIVDRTEEALTRQITGGSPHIARALVQLDGEEHRKMRLLTHSWFTPASILRREERVRAIAKATVERMLSMDGRCDFVQDVALRYPLHVIMEILGVPPQDEAMMLELTQEIFRLRDPGDAAGQDAANLTATLDAALRSLGVYFGGITADRRSVPRDDLSSVIANALIDGQRLGRREELGYYAIIATAGHTTTASSIAGAVWALSERPDQFALLRQDPRLIPSLVEEAVRWTTPVKTFMRTATADSEVAGRNVKAGDWLMLCYASANRDESVFDAPDEFRVTRPYRHLAFGYGGHMCLGQHLARMEMRVLFEELLSRLDSIELDGQPSMSAALFVNGPRTLPVRFRVNRLQPPIK